MSNPSQALAASTALAAALVAGAGLFIDAQALSAEQRASVELLLARADARVVGEASSCCLVTPPQQG